MFPFPKELADCRAISGPRYSRLKRWKLLRFSDFERRQWPPTVEEIFLRQGITLPPLGCPHRSEFGLTPLGSAQRAGFAAPSPRNPGASRGGGCVLTTRGPSNPVGTIAY